MADHETHDLLSRQNFPDRHVNLRNWVALTLALVGFTGLLYGLLDLLRGKTGIAIAISLAIQVLAVSAIREVKSEFARGDSRRWSRILPAFAVYLGAVILTLTFSYSAFYKWLAAESSASKVAAIAVRNLSASLDRLEAKYGALQSLFDDMARHSAALSVEERLRGSTCGFSSPVGEGPVMRFRAREAADFRARREGVTRDIEAAQAIAREVRSMRFSAHEVANLRRDLEHAIARVNEGLIANPALDAAVTFIGTKQAGGAVIPGLGRRCDDDLRDSQLRAAAAALREIRETPPLAPPELFDPQHSTIVKRAFAFVVASLGKLAQLRPAEILSLESISRLPHDPDATSLDALVPDDLFPLIIVLLFEGLLFALITARVDDPERREFFTELRDGRRRLASLGSWMHAAWLLASVPERESVVTLHDSVEASFPRHYGVLTKYLHRLTGSWLLVVPIEPGTWSERLLAHGLEDLGAGHLINDNVAIEHIPPSMRARLALPDTTAADARYAVWKVTPRFFRWARFDQLRGQWAPTRQS